MRAGLQPRHLLSKLPLAFGILLLVAFSVWLASFVPNADWFSQFDPTARGVLQGRSPYDQPVFSNPPWASLLLVPFVLLPPDLARGLVLVCTVASWVFVGWRLHAPKFAMIALLLSPTAIAALLAANLDAFVILGVLLPPAWGLLLLMIKPQIGVGPAAYYLVEAWRNSRAKGVLRTFMPVVAAFLLSAILFPGWMGRFLDKPANVWNRSLFPYGIPLGALFLWLSVRSRNVFWAIASTPFLTPYLTFPTYLVVQIGLLHEDVEKYVRRDLLQIGLCVVLWVLMLVFRL